MPTYDYVCHACGHEFELFQSMTARVKRKCPECGKPKLERLIGTGAGVIFKGGGFYQTDYRSDSYKKAAEAEKKTASGDDGSKKADSGDAKKPAEKAASKSDAKAASTKPKGKKTGKDA